MQDFIIGLALEPGQQAGQGGGKRIDPIRGSGTVPAQDFGHGLGFCRGVRRCKGRKQGLPEPGMTLRERADFPRNRGIAYTFFPVGRIKTVENKRVQTLNEACRLGSAQLAEPDTGQARQQRDHPGPAVECVGDAEFPVVNRVQGVTQETAIGVGRGLAARRPALEPVARKCRHGCTPMLAKSRYLQLGRASKTIGSASMRKLAILAASVFALPLTGCLSPSLDFHGYIPDEVQPYEIKPDEDTRSSVIAQLGSPSTEGLFDTNTWFYVSDVQERFAFYKPEVSDRTITAIKFGEDDKVDEVLRYTAEDGQVISYAARETATRGRELGLLEQIFGTVSSVRLPTTDEVTPGNPTGRQGQ